MGKSLWEEKGPFPQYPQQRDNTSSSPFFFPSSPTGYPLPCTPVYLVGEHLYLVEQVALLRHFRPDLVDRMKN